MDETQMFIWIMMAGGVTCSLFGLMFLGTPQYVHKLNIWIGHSIASIDSTVIKHHWLSGCMFLAVGIFLLYMTIQFP